MVNQSIVKSIMKTYAMNYFKYTAFLAAGTLLAGSVSSCKNSDTDFPDYEGGVTAYFAKQDPVRTLILGEYEEGDNSLDNQHKCMIFATQGGAYKSRDLSIEVTVDNTLVNDLYFEDGSPVKAMPAEYYSLASTMLTKKKDYLFGTEVTFTDAFFADPDALKNTYVIPLVMLKANGADRILTGTIDDAYVNDSPLRTDESKWKVLPQDYVLYCVKYVNPWHAAYLRRGTDKITANGVITTEERKHEYVEQDEVVNFTTIGLNKCNYVFSHVFGEGDARHTYSCNLEITVGADGQCTVSSSDNGVTVSGSGSYKEKGEKNSWGRQDRDAFYLDYTVVFNNENVKFEVSDIFVLRSRDFKGEYFNPVYRK